MVDDGGNLVDGDQLLGLIAASWHADHRMRGDGVVATIMSNLGLERYLAARGLALHRTRVGDRYVVERMRADGYNVGGAVGHIVLSDFATTGDGLPGGAAGAGGAAAARPAGQRGRTGVRAGSATAAQRQGAQPHRPGAPEVAGLVAREEARLDGTGRLRFAPPAPSR